MMDFTVKEIYVRHINQKNCNLYRQLVYDYNVSGEDPNMDYVWGLIYGYGAARECEEIQLKAGRILREILDKIVSGNVSGIVFYPEIEPDEICLDI